MRLQTCCEFSSWLALNLIARLCCCFLYAGRTTNVLVVSGLNMSNGCIDCMLLTPTIIVAMITHATYFWNSNRTHITWKVAVGTQCESIVTHEYVMRNKQNGPVRGDLNRLYAIRNRCHECKRLFVLIDHIAQSRNCAHLLGTWPLHTKINTVLFL